jgi:hypothetical protein
MTLLLQQTGAGVLLSLRECRMAAVHAAAQSSDTGGAHHEVGRLRVHHHEHVAHLLVGVWPSHRVTLQQASTWQWLDPGYLSSTMKGERCWILTQTIKMSDWQYHQQQRCAACAKGSPLTVREVESKSQVMVSRSPGRNVSRCWPTCEKPWPRLGSPSAMRACPCGVCRSIHTDLCHRCMQNIINRVCVPTFALSTAEQLVNFAIGLGHDAMADPAVEAPG